MHPYRVVAVCSLVLVVPWVARADVDATLIWQKKCASCHGKDGKADTEMGRKQKIKDMTTAEWQVKEKDSAIKDAIENGVKDTKMKPFKDKLMPEEIDALVAYVRGLKK